MRHSQVSRSAVRQLQFLRSIAGGGTRWRKPDESPRLLLSVRYGNIREPSDGGGNAMSAVARIVSQLTVTCGVDVLWRSWYGINAH